MLGRRDLGGVVGLIAVVLVIVALANSHSSSSPSSASSDVQTAASPQPDAPTDTPTATPAPATSIGQSVLTTDGNTVTVEKTAPASSGNMFETPPAGGAFFAAEIKECSGAQELTVNPAAWSAKLADATQIDATFGVEMSPNPELKLMDLNPNSCTDGWVYFPLPPNAAPKEIHLLRADFYWTL